MPERCGDITMFPRAAAFDLSCCRGRGVGFLILALGVEYTAVEAMGRASWKWRVLSSTKVR
jgi:hypothetical protein